MGENVRREKGGGDFKTSTTNQNETQDIQYSYFFPILEVMYNKRACHEIT